MQERRGDDAFQWYPSHFWFRVGKDETVKERGMVLMDFQVNGSSVISPMHIVEASLPFDVILGTEVGSGGDVQVEDDGRVVPFHYVSKRMATHSL